tara:strand:+ start:3841 stop:4179 length:339 start_codon:yes stop_codon:yes gene_type:complete
MKNITLIIVGFLIGLLTSNFTIEASDNSNYETILTDYTNINHSFDFSLHESNANIILEKINSHLKLSSENDIREKFYLCHDLTNKVGNDFTQKYTIDKSYLKEIDKFYNTNC